MARIHEAMSEIIKEATSIGKDSINKMQGFNYRGIDAVMNHLHPVFAKHGVVIMPEVLEDKSEERETKAGGTLIYRILKIKFHFVAEDGSEITATMMGEGMDSGDKAITKAHAVALKYVLTQALLLPYDEVDPDGDTPPDSKKKISGTQPSKQGGNILEDNPNSKNPTPEAPVTKKTNAITPIRPQESSGGGHPQWQQLRGCITEKQGRRLFAIAHKANVSDETLKQQLTDLGIEHTNQIPKDQYEEICEWAEAGGQEPPTDAEQDGNINF